MSVHLQHDASDSHLCNSRYVPRKQRNHIHDGTGTRGKMIAELDTRKRDSDEV